MRFWGLAASNYRCVARYLVLEKAQSKWVECIDEFLAVSFRDLLDGWVTSATPTDPNHMFYVYFQPRIQPAPEYPAPS